MSQYLFLGFVLGLSAGLAPGPLLTLVISETLAYDIRAGIRVALVPVITDLPVVLACLFVFSRLSSFETILALISLAGGALLLHMGYGGLRTSGVTLDLTDAAPKSLLKGVAVNLLNPHPYLFWIAIGSPAVTRAWEISPGAAAGFIAAFYLLLIGSKVVLAVVTGRSRSFLSGKIYIYTMKALGLALCVLALLLIRDGLQFLRP
jgi:threonine/homoserine/homoserine lactone efflux protein